MIRLMCWFGWRGSNPVYKIVFYDKVSMPQKGAEKTAVRFTLSGDGEVININRLEKKLVSF